MTTVFKDGLHWPLETFVDAYNFTPVTGWNWPAFDGLRRVYVVFRDGMLGEAAANCVDWSSVVAAKAADGREISCRHCGVLTEVEDGHCDDCWDHFDGHWQC
jgi:hypothetical protein